MKTKTSSQYFKILIDDNTLLGSSKNPNYMDWVEGRYDFSLFSEHDSVNIDFSSLTLSFLVSSSLVSLYEIFLTGRYNSLKIIGVNRSPMPNSIGGSFESHHAVFSDCFINSIKYVWGNGALYMNADISFGTIDVFFNVFDSKSHNVKKIGPIKHSQAVQTAMDL